MYGVGGIVEGDGVSVSGGVGRVVVEGGVPGICDELDHDLGGSGGGGSDFVVAESTGAGISGSVVVCYCLRRFGGRGQWSSESSVLEWSYDDDHDGNAERRF